MRFDLLGHACALPCLILICCDMMGRKEAMKETTIKIIPARIELTPEARALGERIDNPQDLNDAILAVQVEEHAARATVAINGQIQSFIAKCLGMPWK